MVALVRCCARPVLRGEILGKVKSGGIPYVYLCQGLSNDPNFKLMELGLLGWVVLVEEYHFLKVLDQCSPGLPNLEVLRNSPKK